ncbi:Tad domain-containing protein [Alteraurantiacibacter aquimixticola]|uniref:Putative Flp pilus-assembly TadG-like N-terminal domain-containing protein n=1 Tax=Alteraurantiacibacter aquimixticola TaxID=2489173 RepID=A0A4T3F1Y7_9SPHN|nr:Tad domain-containing protein [Alteraurantiacibacter aquimixticola]TIX50060.1 hypothetical protein E5222_07105 [Alteraurantiacibacter aquimixticola]
MTTKTFLGTLLRDTSANVLALSAAALIPLVVVVGSTVDVSRYYMARTRLQNACDAGALAARKSMTSDTFEEKDLQQGLAFFDNNYPAGTFNLQNLERSYVADSEGIVKGEGKGVLPTSMMSIFGLGTFPLKVRCSAEINISHTDIMFVLDVTGSMNCPETNSGCGNNGNKEEDTSKIVGLRQAVVDFYNTVEGASDGSARIRYGFVPYSQQVNVGGSIDPQYMANSASYNTRVPEFGKWGSEEDFEWGEISNRRNYQTKSTEDLRVDEDVTSESQCEAAGLAAGATVNYEDAWTGELWNVSEGNETTIPKVTITTDVRGSGKFRRGVVYGDWVKPRRQPGKCTIKFRVDEYSADYTGKLITHWDPEPFGYWNYKSNEWDVSGLYGPNKRITLPTGENGTDQIHTWNGCIEEAKTIKNVTTDPLNPNAYDLDINLVPSTDEQRWKPALPSVYWERKKYRSTLDEVTSIDWPNQDQPDSDATLCPKAAVRLAEMDLDTVTNYVSYSHGFRARGSTYHDIGMLWGARFISPRGMYRSDNEALPNGEAISRHIVFMTDGIMQPNATAYSPYGVHWWDRRVTTATGSDTLTSVHTARFLAACRQARAENISVWVVAFGTSLSDDLKACATPGRAFEAAKSSDLSAKFKEIADKIASLRLTN